MHLFAYGTLMFPEIWNGVVERRFATREATLPGFAVYRVVDGVYPVMVEAEAGARVEGVVYLDVDDRSLAKLDDYESELYERRQVEVVAEGGDTLACQAYVLPGTRRQFASDHPWDREWFRREAMAEYLRAMESW